jgi:hypothetical protein
MLPDPREVSEQLLGNLLSGSYWPSLGIPALSGLPRLQAALFCLFNVSFILEDPLGRADIEADDDETDVEVELYHLKKYGRRCAVRDPRTDLVPA